MSAFWRVGLEAVLGGLSVLALLMAGPAAAAQTPAWKLKVSVERAAVRLEPDLRSPVLTTLAKGTALDSSEAAGAWFRVVVPAGREGVTLIGFVASNEVEIVEEKTGPQRDFWAPEEGSFQGLGFDIVLGAGLLAFGGGDVAKGVRGMYDELAASVEDLGFPVEERKFRPLHQGVQASVDVIWNLGRRLGLGIGGGYLYARRIDTFSYIIGGKMYSANSLPLLISKALRPKAHYTIPLSRLVALRLSGGPAIILAKFQYEWNIIIPGWEKTFYLRTRKTILGAEGGAALEVSVNPRTAFVLQAVGRYGRSSNVTGRGRHLDMWEGLDVSGPEIQGPLYFLSGGRFPALDVSADPPGGGARKARIDFSGVDLSVGLRVKF